MPDVEGSSAQAATIVRWFKKEGDAVRSGEPLLLVEFPKVEIEVPSPASGTLTKIIKREGRIVRVHDSIGSIQT